VPREVCLPFVRSDFKPTTCAVIAPSAATGNAFMFSLFNFFFATFQLTLLYTFELWLKSRESHVWKQVSDLAGHVGILKM
jgi:hypothetical protein